MDLKKLQAPLDTQLALLGFELVYLEAAKEGKDDILRLFIDHLDGSRPITLDDCIRANEGLVAWMDVEFPSLREDIGVEISSPGLERPLTKPEHFRRFAGRLCRIQTSMPLNGQKRFKGWIGEVSSESVTIEEDGVLKTVPFSDMQKARLAPFDEAKAPKPRIVAMAAVEVSAGVEKSSGEEA